MSPWFYTVVTMDTNKEARTAFLNLGYYWAKNATPTINWSEISLVDGPDTPHHVQIYVDPGTLEAELERKPELFIASGIVDLVSDVEFIEAEHAQLY